MNVNIYYTKAYINDTAFRRGQNKPNSKPIQTQTNPISENPKMNVNVAFTRNYHNNQALPLRKNKPKTNPISKRAENELNHLFYNELRQSAPLGGKSNQTQFSEEQRWPYVLHGWAGQNRFANASVRYTLSDCIEGNSFCCYGIRTWPNSRLNRHRG